MKIRSLLVMKDEGDVIGESIGRALEWSDQILVLDNGSSDGGWETVSRMALVEPRISVIGRISRHFNDGFRAHCFHAAKREAEPGDWWCRLDADEIYAEDPRPLLASMPNDVFSVWSAELTYFLTDVDVERYERNPGGFLSLPVELKCRHYINYSSEPRFFRHERRLQWIEEDSGFPPVLWRRPAARRRILLKNFRYRSPDQIQRRLDARRSIPYAEFSHERISDWQTAVAGIRTAGALVGSSTSQMPRSWTERVAPSTALDYDNGDGNYVLNPDLMPTPPSPLEFRTLVGRMARARLRHLVPVEYRTNVKLALGRAAQR